MSVTELKTKEEIDQYLDTMSDSNPDMIAIDIEGEFNLHCYGEHLCLVQIYDGTNEIIIDPFKLKDFAALKSIFEKRDLLKIMYDATSDAALLSVEYGIRIKSILDLRPAVMLLDYQKQSLSNVLAAELGIDPGNKKSFKPTTGCEGP